MKIEENNGEIIFWKLQLKLKTIVTMNNNNKHSIVVKVSWWVNYVSFKFYSNYDNYIHINVTGNQGIYINTIYIYDEHY